MQYDYDTFLGHETYHLFVIIIINPVNAYQYIFRQLDEHRLEVFDLLYLFFQYVLDDEEVIFAIESNHELLFLLRYLPILQNNILKLYPVPFLKDALLREHLFGMH